MQLSDIPGKSPLVFGAGAAGAYIRSVPQTSTDPAAASFTLGFPPQTFTDESAGGTPPDGRDVNGMLAYLSAWSRWQQAGAAVVFDPTFSTAIGGYPDGSIVKSTVTAGIRFINTANNNTTDPDSGSSANWVKTIGLLSENTGVTGHRAWSDGWIDEWGRVNVPAGGSVTVNMQVTHTSYITPTLGAIIVTGAGTPGYIGVSAIGLNSFVISNNGTVDQIVPWTANGR